LFLRPRPEQAGNLQLLLPLRSLAGMRQSCGTEGPPDIRASANPGEPRVAWDCDRRQYRQQKSVTYAGGNAVRDARLALLHDRGSVVCGRRQGLECGLSTGQVHCLPLPKSLGQRDSSKHQPWKGMVSLQSARNRWPGTVARNRRRGIGDEETEIRDRPIEEPGKRRLGRRCFAMHR